MRRTAWVGCDSTLGAPVKPIGMTLGAGASPVAHIAEQERQSKRNGCDGVGAGGAPWAALTAGTQISFTGPAVTADTAKPDKNACNATA